jgi:hypothetical protein
MKSSAAQFQGFGTQITAQTGPGSDAEDEAQGQQA